MVNQPPLAEALEDFESKLRATLLRKAEAQARRAEYEEKIAGVELEAARLRLEHLRRQINAASSSIRK